MLWLFAGLLTLAAEPLVQPLESFESPDSLARWTRTAAQVERVTDGATDGRFALRVEFQAIPAGKEGWPAVKWTHTDAHPFPITDWRRYDALAFDARSLSPDDLDLKLRLDDAAGAKWTAVVPLAAGAAIEYRVPIHEFGGGLDPARMAHLDIYLSSPHRPQTVVIDHVRLVAGELAIAADRSAPDPFATGRARFRARLTRAVPWRLDILRGGEVVRTANGDGQEVSFDWHGQDDAGRALPEGGYTSRLTLTDPLRDNAVQRLDWLPVQLGGERPELLVWPAGTGEKIFLDDYPRRPLTAPLTVHLVKNEVEAQQFVIQSARDLDRVSVTLENLRNPAATGPAPELTIHQVGYVDCAQPPYDTPRLGWWPDPLLPVSEFALAAYDAQPVWLSWRTTPATATGTWLGEVVVTPSRGEPVRVPVELRVHDVTLPVSTRLRTAFSTYDQYIAKMHPDAPRDEIMMKYWDFIADHRINPDNIYRKEPPRLEVLEKFQAEGRLNAYCIRSIPRRQEPWTAELKAELAAQLDPFMAELRKRPEVMAKGYFYGYDEANPEFWDAMRDIFGWLKERYPEIPTMTTAYDHSFGTKTGLNDVVDIWVPLTPRYHEQLAEQVRAGGGDVWWYTCIGPKHPYANWFIEYEALEARLLFWQAYQHGSSGHLYYTMTRWPLSGHPIDPAKGARTDWPAASYKTANGDGSLFCAGPDGPLTTIRFENVRDGLEDAELLAMLDDLRQGREDAAPAGKAFVDRISPTLTEYTRDTEELLAVRREIIAAIEQLR